MLTQDSIQTHPTQPNSGPLYRNDPQVGAFSTPVAHPTASTESIRQILSDLTAQLKDRDRVDTDPLRRHVLDLTEWVESLSQQQRAQREKIQTVLRSMRKAGALEQAFQISVSQIHQHFGWDRVLMYQVNDATQGVVVAEALREGFTPALGENLPLVTFWRGSAQREIQDPLAVAAVGQADLSPYQQQLLDRFQVKAYLSLPIITEAGLWGLLVIQHCQQSWLWSEAEIQLLDQVAQQLGMQVQMALVQVKIQQQLQEKAAIERVIAKIREPLEPQQIFQTVTLEIRRLLNCDRAVVYRFNPDWSGDFVAESVTPEWVPLVGKSVKDTYLEINSGGRYAKGESQTVDDIYATGFDPCHLQLLEQFQARAYVLVPMFAGTRLWGILGAYQNSAPRHWEPQEIEWLQIIGQQLGVAARQADALVQMQTKNDQLTQLAAREQAINKVIDKIRQTLDLPTIFKTTTKEVRLLLKADRVGIYQFNPDWSGGFISESVASGWQPLVDRQTETPTLQESLSDCNGMRSLILSQSNQAGTQQLIKPQYADTYLQQTQGGRFKEGLSFTVSDIYAADFAPCYLEVLEEYQCRAYVIIPVFRGETLWGMLATYQNTGPRHWDEGEINLLKQVATQLGIAIQQADYLAQVESQSQQLAASAERERTAKEKLQQGALRVLRALEPSFRGDLTVRAPLTEDEIGTIADGYNTTIQNLRELVRQVQIAAGRASQTSSSNTEAVAQLSAQAQQQVQEIQSALNHLRDMVNSIQTVAGDAEAVEQAVQEANRTVQAGDSLMEQTVSEILTIRETVSEAGRKIKRLGESSQKISKVVSLIENFATQTNLLALNAAIEATRAGEYGRGFAVVADEVRSLAYQSANATTEIERLVQEIQAETRSVAEAMDLGISQVVQGTHLVNETRQSLTAIGQATDRISQLVTMITQATAEQTQQSQVLTQVMNEVAEIAEQTSDQSVQISNSFQALQSTSQELQTHVSQFKVD